jgi:hypothetical protein
MLAYLALSFAAIIVTGTAAAWVHDVLADRLNGRAAGPWAGRPSSVAAPARRGTVQAGHGYGAPPATMTDPDFTPTVPAIAAATPIAPDTSPGPTHVRVRRPVRGPEATVVRGRYLPPPARSILPGTVRVRGA